MTDHNLQLVVNALSTANKTATSHNLLVDDALDFVNLIKICLDKLYGPELSYLVLE